MSWNHPYYVSLFNENCEALFYIDVQGDYDSLQHVYTHDQPEIHEYMATWRELIEHLNNILNRKMWASISTRLVSNA